MAMTSDEQTNSAADQYNAAFAEGPQTSAPLSDDEAFGITPPAEAVAAAEADEAGTAAGTGGEAIETTQNAGSATSDNDQNQPAEQEAVDPKEVQRLKSWEGRLKKLEAELKGKGPVEEPAAVEALEGVSEQAEDAGQDALGEAAEQAAEQVEDGSLTVAQAMKQLAEDFGDDFVKMIEAIASAKAADVGGQAVASVKGEVDDIIHHIKDSTEKAHFARIAQACPDFNDVRQDPAFAAFAQSSPELQKVVASGSADEVIQLIKDYKASTANAQAPAEEAAPAKTAKPAEQEPGEVAQSDPEGADAAAGVRSGGLRLPAQPVDADDYEGAFNEAAKAR